MYICENCFKEYDLSLYTHLDVYKRQVIKANTTHENEWTIEGDAKTILGKLGFTEFNTVVDRLSGGEKKRLSLIHI